MIALLLLACTSKGPDTGLDPTPYVAETCPDGPFECAWDQGCEDGVCGSCADNDGCLDTEACVDGRCGACSQDAPCRDDQRCVEGVCVQAAIPEWDLQIASSDWDRLEEYWYDDVYVPSKLTADGVDYGACEVRLRGNSTRALPKHSFRIRFAEGAAHPGYARKINLRAEYNDPSFLRTFLSLQAQRHLSPVPTPRARFVHLSINGEEYGLMLEVERVGGKFMERLGRDRDNPRFEVYDADPGGAFVPREDASEYAQFYENKVGDPADTADIQTLIEDALVPDWDDSLGQEDATATRTVDAIREDGFIQYLATMAAVQSNDHVSNNFSLSWQSAGPEDPGWEFFSDDLDLTLGCHWDEANADPICDDFSTDGWWLNGIYIVDDSFVLGQTPYWGNLAIDRVLAPSALRARYLAELCKIVQGDWWLDRMGAVGGAVAQNISPLAQADPNDLSTDAGALTDAQDQVLGFMGLRAAYLSDSLECP